MPTSQTASVTTNDGTPITTRIGKGQPVVQPRLSLSAFAWEDQMVFLRRTVIGVSPIVAVTAARASRVTATWTSTPTT